MRWAMTPVWCAVEPDGTLSFSGPGRSATDARHWGERYPQATEAEARDQVTYPLTPRRWSSIDYGTRFAGVPT